MAINELRLPYPDFQMGKIIDPEEHDLNNEYIANKINDLVELLNILTDGEGATQIKATPVTPFTATNVQGILDELINRLQAKTTESGASLIGSPALIKIAGDTVGAQLQALDNMLQTAYVITSSIADLAVTTEKLAQSSVTTDKLADGSITTPKLADNSVSTAKVIDGSITTPKLADGNVTTIKLADLAVISEKIANLAITTAKLADASVTTVKLGADSVTTAKLGNASVTEQKLSDLAVTANKIALNAINTSHIASGAITSDKIANRAITSAKIGTQVVKAEHLDPILLEALPNTLLTAKVLTLENEMDAVQYKDILQDQSIDEVSQELNTHENARLPHTVTDSVTGIEYRTGWVVENGELYFEYEEVE